jgi:hypothetical protein
MSQSICHASGKQSPGVKVPPELVPKFPWASMSQYSSTSSKRARFMPMPANSGSIWSVTASGEPLTEPGPLALWKMFLRVGRTPRHLAEASKSHRSK